MDHIPKDVVFAAKRLANYNRNRFRLETVSAETAGPGRIVTANLPDGALLDMKSFKWHFDVACTEVVNATAARTVRGRLPADASSLISRVECFLNGIQIEQGTPEYGTLCRMLKIGRSSRDKDGSIDRTLHHGAVVSADAAEDVSVVVSEWCGFLGETATRYLPMDLLGQLQVRITLAPASVLIPKQEAVAIGTNFNHAEARAGASQVTYSVSNMYFTVDSVSVDDMYNQMLRERLSTEEFIPLNYKEYYSFSLDGISTNSHTTRFSLSATSIDRMYATFRDSNFQTTGIRGHSMTASTFSETGCSNALRFRSYNDSNTKQGSFSYQWSVNNVKMPQYRAGVMDALFDLAYTNDKVHDGSPGNMVTSLAQYNDGMFVLPLTLCHPGEGLNVQSGYNSKGINTMLTLEIQGQTPPTASADSGETNALSSYVLVETTAQLRIGLGKNLGVAF